MNSEPPNDRKLINRDLIRKYFECLRNRNTKTEIFSLQIFSNLFLSWDRWRLSQEGFISYIILGVLLISYFINPLLTIGAILLLCVPQIPPNPKLPISDYQFNQWLDLDREYVYSKAIGELNVRVLGESETRPLEALNIVMKSINLTSGFALETQDADLVKFRDLKDYFCEQRFRDYEKKGVQYRYSIHLFTKIVLCRNFLAYYKCHWNFIRGIETLVETGEYLYDSIVSVRTEEISLATANIVEKLSLENFKQDLEVEDLKNLDKTKFVVKEVLIIGTTDGHEISFPVLESRIVEQSNLESDTSSVKDAARIIRSLLRQRRIDLQIVKPFDADD